MRVDELKRAFPTMPGACHDAMIAAVRGVREETIMRKKWTTALAVALVLMLLVGGAFAYSQWRDSAVQIADIEAKSGYFHDWPLAERIKLLQILVDSGEIKADDERVAPLLSGQVTGEAAENLSLRVMLDWMGTPFYGPVSLLSVLQRLWGPMGWWTLEDKAWYTQMATEAGLLKDEEIRYTLPREGEITQDEAQILAARAIEGANGLVSGTLDGFGSYASFYVTKNAPDSPRWYFEFYLLPSDSEPEKEWEIYSVAVDAGTGDVILDPGLCVLIPDGQMAVLSEIGG